MATLIAEAHLDKKTGQMRIYLDVTEVQSLIRALHFFCRKNAYWTSEEKCIAEMTDLRNAITEAMEKNTAGGPAV